ALLDQNRSGTTIRGRKACDDTGEGLGAVGDGAERDCASTGRWARECRDLARQPFRQFGRDFVFWVERISCARDRVLDHHKSRWSSRCGPGTDRGQSFFPSGPAFRIAIHTHDLVMDNSISVSEGLISLDRGFERVRCSFYNLVGDSRFSRDKLKT